jgi:hypothetical protein
MFGLFIQQPTNPARECIKQNLCIYLNEVYHLIIVLVLRA